MEPLRKKQKPAQVQDSELELPRTPEKAYIPGYSSRNLDLPAVLAPPDPLSSQPTSLFKSVSSQTSGEDEDSGSEIGDATDSSIEDEDTGFSEYPRNDEMNLKHLKGKINKLQQIRKNSARKIRVLQKGYDDAIEIAMSAEKDLEHIMRLYISRG
ncbi:hypothetical protein L873DRAFT_685709 [Choiromyces venosus 120613-1]|uniref:Uncharacterized protein n=1 Tax=Choiromyces venosus 120613-1 TaxID=1336337 RepID=A0A3N4K5B7_9PEZI|nr:hypothetical protein L873DRAFT_685709 [Choiromyces venosus 120613-1]